MYAHHLHPDCGQFPQTAGYRSPDSLEAAKEMVEEAQQEDTEVESTWEQEYLRGLYIAIAVVLILFLICIVVALLGRNNDA